MQESLEVAEPALDESRQPSKRKFFRPALVAAMLIAGILLVAPFYFYGVKTGKGSFSVLPITHDMAQHLAIMTDYDEVLRSGTLYPRWLPNVNAGYGLAWTNFYSPAFYYSTSLVNAALNDWYKTMFVVCVLSLFASGMAFYLFSRQFYGRWASAAAGLFYMALPYHTVDLYWRGALPELQGFVLAPLIMYFAFKAGSRGRLTDYAGLGLCQGVYYVTHFPVAYLMTYTVAFYALVWALSKKDWRILLRVGIGMTLALAFSAIYWLPAVLESKYADEHFTTIFPYHNSYITLLPVNDPFAQLINRSFAVQSLALIAAITILWVTNRVANQAYLNREGKASPLAQTHLWVTLGVATTFMLTPYSIYISKLIPKIEAVSFVMRWMVITSFFTALVAAAALDRLRRYSLPSAKVLWACRAAFGVIIVLNLWVSVGHILMGGMANPPLTPPAIHYETAFIPKGGAEPRSLHNTALVVVTPDGGAGDVIRWEPAFREVTVNASQPSTVRLKSYNFPGWSARLNGQAVPIVSDSNGVQVIEVPAGNHRLEVTFGSTPPRTAGALLTGLTFLTFVGLFVLDRLRRPKLQSPQEQDSPGEIDIAKPAR